MHVIYLVRRGCKYHTDQSHRILLTHYFFTSRRRRHFALSPLAVQWSITYALSPEQYGRLRIFNVRRNQMVRTVLFFSARTLYR